MDNMQPLAELKNITVINNGRAVLDDITLNIGQHEQWAIVGDSGSGKTTLAKAITGTIFFNGTIEWHLGPDGNGHVELVEQQHHFKNRQNTGNFYYQQRFNASEADDSMTVNEILGDGNKKEKWIELLHLSSLLDKPIIQLSNGQHKRLQLARALLNHPGILVLDNPFIGLDVEGRRTLRNILDEISKEGIHIILITPPSELPDAVTHVAVLANGRLVSKQARADYLASAASSAQEIIINADLLDKLKVPGDNDFTLAVQMEDVTIRYGEKTVLDRINWTVKKGECWNVSGPNGAGKSTLLSLITADNPQAYANRIFLFDRRRGSGESIWDIKKRIGFVSPELHLFFENTASCFEVVASGLFDTIGLFRVLSDQQKKLVELWLELMKLEGLAQKRIFQLSASQQRMALLARALVKNPPMLILDEPMQGLDGHQSAYFKSMVDAICIRFGTTLIYVSHYSSDLPVCINNFLKLEDGKRC